MKPARLIATALLSACLVVGVPGLAVAHCDGMDGPVVRAAQKALETGDVSHALIWVRAEDEREARAAFEKTLAVRAGSKPAKALADKFFFETLVRIHRVAEGAAFTGLALAGRDLGPAIPAAVRALVERSPEALMRLLNAALLEGIHTL